MMIEVLKSKIHCARVTEANLNYMGSITIDEDLLDAANMIPGEKVYIADNNNGERFETYIIKGERGSGKICLNGAAARKVQPDDIVIIMSYALMDFEEAKPRLHFVDGAFLILFLCRGTSDVPPTCELALAHLLISGNLVTGVCLQLFIHGGSGFTAIAHRQNNSSSTANDIASCINHRDGRFHVIIHSDGSFSS